MFKCKGEKDCYVLWEVDENGQIMYEHIFSRENFPEAELAFSLGSWIKSNGVTNKEMQELQILRKTVMDSGLTITELGGVIKEFVKARDQLKGQ